MAAACSRSEGCSLADGRKARFHQMIQMTANGGSRETQLLSQSGRCRRASLKQGTRDSSRRSSKDVGFHNPHVT
jgi:hypothetical protein